MPRTYQCGICPNCLLRRSSLLNALPTTAYSEQYLWNDLTKPDFEKSLNNPIPLIKHDRQVARSGVLIMQLLAKTESNPRLPIEIHKLNQALDSPVDEIRKNVINLFKQHKQEWDFFLDQCTSPNSWVRAVCEAA